MLATIPLDLIENGQRLRDLSEATVVALVNSIGDVGLLNPITVYRRQLFQGGNSVEGYGLVAGLHRKTACERLGLVEIEANILDLSDLECQIAECDENLCAPQLTAADKARFTKRRKEAYEALHPETKHGDRARFSRPANDEAQTPRFTKDTAAATGQSERKVQLDAERGEKIDGRVLDLVQNTKLNTGTYLDKLKGLSAADQMATVKRDLAELKKPKVAPRKITRPADPPLDDEDAKERQVAALMSAWNKASAEARQEFLDRIDVPVMDRTAA